MANNSTNSSGASSMAELMARQAKTFKTFHKGDIVKGTITKLTSHEILVDIDAKTEAVVMEKDRRLLRNLLATLKVGEAVDVQILNPENDMGQPVVSLRRFMEGNTWEMLENLKKNNETLSVTVTDSTKGGFVVETPFGSSGFLPQSHLSSQTDQQNLVGKQLTVSVLELNKNDNKIIFSQKTNMPVAEFEKLTSQFKNGDKIDATVSNVTSFGVFVTVTAKGDDGDVILDGLVHISEISWEKVSDISGMFTPGQTIQAVVIGKDAESRRVDLSIKRLTADPFEKIKEQFPVDKKVSGTVTEIVAGNVHVDLGDRVEGIIRKEKIPPTMTFEVGKSVNATVTEVDARRHRILLTPVLTEKPLTYR